MGFRSNVIGDQYLVEWPEWFKEKHSNLSLDGNFLVSKCEFKTYFTRGQELPEDVQKALKEVQPEFLDGSGYSLIYLHECGGVTKVQILKDRILYGVPDGWRFTLDGSFGHYYCYGCSDLRKCEDE